MNVEFVTTGILSVEVRDLDITHRKPSPSEIVRESYLYLLVPFKCPVFRIRTTYEKVNLCNVIAVVIDNDNMIGTLQ